MPSHPGSGDDPQLSRQMLASAAGELKGAFRVSAQS